MDKQDIMLERANTLLTERIQEIHASIDISDDSNYDIVFENKKAATSWGGDSARALTQAEAEDIVAALTVRRRETPNLWGPVEQLALEVVCASLGVTQVFEHRIKLRGKFSFTPVIFDGEPYELVAAMKLGAAIHQDYSPNPLIEGAEVKDLIAKPMGASSSGPRPFLVTGYLELPLVVHMDIPKVTANTVAHLIRASMQVDDSPVQRTSLFDVSTLAYSVS